MDHPILLNIVEHQDRWYVSHGRNKRIKCTTYDGIGAAHGNRVQPTGDNHAI